MACRALKAKKTRICVSSLDKKIKIQSSSSKANNSPDTNASVIFTDEVSVWSMIDTNANNDFIDGVNVSNGINTDFYIRFTNSIDLNKQIWVEHSGIRYKISGVEDISKENRFIRLRAVEKGSKFIAANQR